MGAVPTLSGGIGKFSGDQPPDSTLPFNLIKLRNARVNRHTFQVAIITHFVGFYQDSVLEPEVDRPEYLFTHRARLSPVSTKNTKQQASSVFSDEACSHPNVLRNRNTLPYILDTTHSGVIERGRKGSETLKTQRVRP